MEMDNTAQPTENRLPFYSNVGRLEERACVVVAASIWHVKEQECRHNDTYPLKRLAKHYFRTADIAHVPSIIRDMIDEWTSVVENSIVEWAEFHHQRIFPHCEKSAPAYDLIDLICWRSDGSINYDQTARNLVQSERLTEVERYRVACIYCFVDDIDTLWPMTNTDPDHPLIEYWKSRMSCVASCSSSTIEEGSSCVEDGLLKHCAADTWSAFRYLWQYLSDDERVRKVAAMGYTNDYKMLKYVLCELNDIQLERVMVSNAEDIMLSLLQESESLTLHVWKYVKHMIKYDEFFAILRSCLDENGKGYDITYEMWISASDELRKEVSDRFSDTLIGMLCYQDSDSMNGLNRDVRLLIELLSARSAESRETIWRENWQQIIVGVAPKYLEQLLKLCLESDDKITSFKNTRMCNYVEMEHYFSILLFDGNLKELSEILKFSTNDPEVIFNLRVRVLKSETLLRYYINFWKYIQEMDSLDEFLEETFPGNTDRLNEFKRDLIMGDESMKFIKYSIRRGMLGGIERLIDRVLPSEQDLTQVKNDLLEYSRGILISGQFEFIQVSDWNDFLKWCLNGGDDSVQRFQQSLPVDEIFITLFERSVQKLTEFLERSIYIRNDNKVSWNEFKCCFHQLEFFVEWISESKEKIASFKLSKLNAYTEIVQIKSVFESNNVIFIEGVLRWFFDDDVSLVENFKASLGMPE